MKKLLAIAVLGLLSSCTFVNAEGEEFTGIPVEEVSLLLHQLADDVALYDIDKNGLIDGNEYVPLGLAVGNHIYEALVAANNKVIDG